MLHLDIRTQGLAESHSEEVDLVLTGEVVAATQQR